MTDEQLLQIIDFNERRDYALAKQNQADRARAAQRPVDETANKLTEDQAIEAAKQYVPNPEEYDFHKILNWK